MAVSLELRLERLHECISRLAPYYNFRIQIGKKYV